MKQIFLNLLIFLTLISCSTLPNTRERKIQTEIISKLTAQGPNLAKCVKNSNLFEKFGVQRLRVKIFLTIGSNGQIQKFALDEQKYPNEYSECTFSIVDTIGFPKIDKNELIELEQTFIFSKE